MKILSIVWYKVLPPRFGGQKGIASFNNQLSRFFPLICLCSNNNEPPDTPAYKTILKLPVSKWQFIDPNNWWTIRKVMREENITHVIVEHPYYGLAAYTACKALNARLIIHSHNIESQRFRQLSKWWWSMLKTYEKWVHRKADFNLFKTNADLDYAVGVFGLQRSKCLVIPYGVENFPGYDHLVAKQEIRRRHEIPSEDKILLFAGTLDYLPNAKAVENIYHEIAPRLVAEGKPFRILICGRLRDAKFRYLSSYSHPNVQMVGEVEEIEPYFAAADLFINPVLSGAGVQTKTIDALAHHCNVVCFEGMVDNDLIGVSGGKLFLSRQEDWANFIILLKSGWNQELKTPTEFFNKYSWEKNIEKLAAVIPSL